MKQKTLTVVRREQLKKQAAKAVRRAGMIPAVVYGHSAPQAIAVSELEFGTKFSKVSENTIIKLQLEEETRDVLIRDFQENLITGRILHIDFYEIERGKLLRTRVPLHLEGTSLGVREGGLLETFVHEVEVECLPRDLPEQIVHDITTLALSHSVHIGDLDLPGGVRILNSTDQVVCTVAHKRVEVEEAAVEEEAEEEEEGVESEEA
jgi:large subunit ribosomal protein L25